METLGQTKETGETRTFGMCLQMDRRRGCDGNRVGIQRDRGRSNLRTHERRLRGVLRRDGKRFASVERTIAMADI